MDAQALAESVITFVATASATYGALRVRLASMEKAIVELEVELKNTRAFAESAKEGLKDRMNTHEHVHGDFHTRISLIEQANKDGGTRFDEFRREFKADTRAQNGILQGLTTTVATLVRASGQMRAIPDTRTEPDSEPPERPSRPELPPRPGYRPPRRSQTNE